MPQTDAEHGQTPDELPELLNGKDIFLGVTGAVGEHNPVKVSFQNLRGGGGSGEDGHFAAALDQASEDIGFGTVVHERDVKTHVPLCGHDAFFRRCGTTPCTR